jgi:hypothetical protein
MTTKICPTCKEEKNLDRFIQPSQWRCKDCDNRCLREYRRKKREAFLAANPKPVATGKACTVCGEFKAFEDFYFANRKKGIRSSYCKRCQIKLGNAHRALTGRNRVRERCSRLRKTVQWFNSQQEAQGNCCAICEQPETLQVRRGGAKIRSLAIDHDHISGTVRGLLCFRCNTALHQLEKNGLGWADKAVAYLKQHKET